MNILITGSNGLLGRNLIYSLGQHNKVYALVRAKNKINFDINDGIEVIESDLANFTTDGLPKNIDAIYYLAQSNRFREFPDGANDMLEVNVYTPLRMIDWAMQNKVKKFIFASSGGVYTNPNKPVKEFFDINANEKHGFYLDSKLSAEILLKNYAQYFETFVIIRPFFMYGKNQNEMMLIPRLIQSVKDGKEILLSGENGIRINPIYIKDAVQSISKILDMQGEHIINIAGKDIVSLKELALLIGDILDKKPLFKYCDNVQNDLIADIFLMKEKLFSPLVTIEDGLKRLIYSP